MSTISSEAVISEMLHNGGSYPGDPPAVAIYQYISQADTRVYNVCYSQQDVNNFLRNGFYEGVPLLLLSDGVLTKAGRDWIRSRLRDKV